MYLPWLTRISGVALPYVARTGADLQDMEGAELDLTREGRWDGPCRQILVMLLGSSLSKISDIWRSLRNANSSAFPHLPLKQRVIQTEAEDVLKGSIVIHKAPGHCPEKLPVKWSQPPLESPSLLGSSMRKYPDAYSAGCWVLAGLFFHRSASEGTQMQIKQWWCFFGMTGYRTWQGEWGGHDDRWGGWQQAWGLQRKRQHQEPEAWGLRIRQMHKSCFQAATVSGQKNSRYRAVNMKIETPAFSLHHANCDTHLILTHGQYIFLWKLFIITFINRCY